MPVHDRDQIESSRRQERLRRNRRRGLVAALVVVLLIIGLVVVRKQFFEPPSPITLAAGVPVRLGDDSWFVAGDNAWAIIRGSTDQPSPQAISAAEWIKADPRVQPATLVGHAEPSGSRAVGWSVFESKQVVRVRMRLNNHIIYRVQLYHLASVPGWKLVTWPQRAARPGDHYGYSFYDADGRPFVYIP